jgi:hypothetical protein
MLENLVNTSLKRRLKMELKDMRINSHPEGCIYEVSFGYHSDLYGYTTLMSDIPMLYAIVSKRLKARSRGD